MFPGGSGRIKPAPWIGVPLRTRNRSDVRRAGRMVDVVFSGWSPRYLRGDHLQPVCGSIPRLHTDAIVSPLFDERILIFSLKAGRKTVGCEADVEHFIGPRKVGGLRGSNVRVEVACAVCRCDDLHEDKDHT
jgi:hypothetical protein